MLRELNVVEQRYRAALGMDFPVTRFVPMSGEVLSLRIRPSSARPQSG